MTFRALIVAIEDYPNAEETLATHLAGTNAAGNAFRDWFIATKHGGLDPGPDFLRYCGAQGQPGVTGGTTRNQILDQLEQLILAGKDRTSELYLFFSGHGFAFDERPGKRKLDVLIASDFVRLAIGGRASILVNDLQENAQLALGPADQYYFIDACRNLIGPNDVRPLPVDNVWPLSQNAMGCVLTLNSTRSGALAHVKSGFAEALLAGLQGAGRAKARIDGARMAVTFDGLTKYVRGQMPDQQPSPSNPQGCDGVIRILSPAPKSLCRVRVNGVDAAYTLDLVLSDVDGVFPNKVVRFQGPAAEIELVPQDYGIAVVDPAGQLLLRRLDPVGDGPVDLWDSRDLVFAPYVAHAGPEPEKEGLPAQFFLSAPLGTHLSMFRSDGIKLFETESPFANPRKVDPGDYRVRIVHAGGGIEDRGIHLGPGEEVRVDIAPLVIGSGGDSIVRDQILRHTGNDPRGHDFEVSESLGKFTDANLGLLLSLLGASRIVEPHQHFEKLRHLPLATFGDLKPGDSVVYILAALDEVGPAIQPLTIGTHHTGAVVWEAARPVPGIPGLSEYRAPAPAGPQLVSFRAFGQPAITLATHALANRATFITVSKAQRANVDDLEIHQYLLPLYACAAGLSQGEREHLNAIAPLRFARLLWRVQDQFSAKRIVKLGPDDANAWDTFLYGKWLDPMIGILSVYELFRRGELTNNPELVATAVDNLTRFFGSIPDSQLLARLYGKAWIEPTSPPLVRHGLLAWPKGAAPSPAPLPREKLLFQSMWTSWQGAV